MTVFVHDGPAPEPAGRERLDALGVSVVEGTVAGLVVEADRLTGVRLDSGDVVPVDAIVVAPVAGARSRILTTLGLATVDVEMAGQVVATRLETDPFGRTSVPGVWAAGSVVEPMAQLMASAASGLMAGAQINADLVETDLTAVIESRRAVAS